MCIHLHNETMNRKIETGKIINNLKELWKKGRKQYYCNLKTNPDNLAEKYYPQEGSIKLSTQNQIMVEFKEFWKSISSTNIE